VLLAFDCVGHAADIEMADILITHGTVITMDPARRVIDDGAVAVVGSGIAGMYGRSALVFAMRAAALARLSGGRFILGLGLQSQRYVEGWHGARYEGMSGFRDRLCTIRSLLAGEAWNGYHLAFPPPAPVPIYTAALGPKMIELAGELADGLLGYFYTRAYIEKIVRPHVEAGVRRAGRSSSDFDLTWGLPVLVSDDPRVRDLMRPQVVMYATAASKSYDLIMQTSGFGDALDDLRRAARARTMDDVVGGRDEMLDAFTLCGTPPRCASDWATSSAPVSARCTCSRFPGHFHPSSRATSRRTARSRSRSRRASEEHRDDARAHGGRSCLAS
jgi:alkanesulfonate monooxygenase SsuD/methylene tetrahydromethanopterin reductase-like flavin-dependent oxidoreductase (luciferase family)